MEMLSSATPIFPTIEDFKILKPISRGAYAKVYLGTKNSNPHQFFAIKIMRKSEMIHKNMTSQVLAERAALALTKSDFVVKLYYSLQSNVNIYLVMDYMIGGDVKSLLSMYGYFDETMAMQYTAEIAMALDYLHKRDIIHRDIKPDNMLIASDGHIKLSDFGLSKVDVDHKLNVKDLLHTPKDGEIAKKESLRTPGQLLSLTSQLAFSPYGSDDTQPLPKPDWSPELEPKRKKRNYDSVKQSSPIQERVSSGLTAIFDDVNIVPPAQKRKAKLREESTLGPSFTSCSSVEQLRDAADPMTMEMKNEEIFNNVSLNFVGGGCDTTSQNLQISPPFTTRAAALTSPIAGDNAPIPFLLSPQADPMSPLGHGLCSSSPDMGNDHKDLTDDSFSLAFTSIKTTDDSASPSNLHFLESIDRSDSQLHLDVPMNSASITEQSMNSAGCDVIDNGSKSFSTLAEKTSATSCTAVPGSSQTPDDTLHKLTPSSKDHRSKKTRFQSMVRSYSSNLEKHCPLKKSNDIPVFLTPAPHKSRRNPMRTPKSTKKKQPQLSQILGTPDYLSPELLLRNPHGPAVDWWALGVCLYEFLTGFPPFCDKTVERIFDNILSNNMEWPEGEEEELSADSQSCIKSLLCHEPSLRANLDTLKQHPLFHGLDWDNIRNVTAPFVPQPDSATDTGYFQPRNQLQGIEMSDVHTGLQ